MSSQLIAIRYEQAVYGSFPFWDKGYAVLAQSPGCRPEWLAEMRGACQRFGERPGGVAEGEVSGLFAMRLASGPWMIVGVGSPGSDDRGRPGALAFHALFLSPREYRRVGCHPFALAGALRDNWTAATLHLPAGTWPVAPADAPADPVDIDPRTAPIASALKRGRRVAIEADAPIDALARQVWITLPERVRRRASVATWAFGNGNRFDLLASPRIAGIERDGSYLDPSALEGADEPPVGAQIQARKLAIRLPIAAAAALAGVLLGWIWRQDDDGVTRARPDPPPARVSPGTTLPVPDRATYRNPPADPDERRRVAEALLALVERFGVAGGGAREDEPAALMILLADRLRYRGPTLSTAELASLEAGPDREDTLALRWHARIRRFAADRRLPDDFARGPLRWQLDTLAWSFHLDPDDDPVASRRSDAEIPHALGEALAVDVPLPPLGLSARHPALAAYRDFLGRLPRR